MDLCFKPKAPNHTRHTPNHTQCMDDDPNGFKHEAEMLRWPVANKVTSHFSTTRSLQGHSMHFLINVILMFLLLSFFEAHAVLRKHVPFSI